MISARGWLRTFSSTAATAHDVKMTRGNRLSNWLTKKGQRPFLQRYKLDTKVTPISARAPPTPYSVSSAQRHKLGQAGQSQPALAKNWVFIAQLARVSCTLRWFRAGPRYALSPPNPNSGISGNITPETPDQYCMYCTNGN